MSETFFAGAFGQDVSGLSAEMKLECKICWHVYDPELGDEVWQIPAGTPFSQLPDHWSCPQCGAPRQDFLILND